MITLVNQHGAFERHHDDAILIHSLGFDRDDALGRPAARFAT